MPQAPSDADGESGVDQDHLAEAQDAEPSSSRPGYGPGDLPAVNR